MKANPLEIVKTLKRCLRGEDTFVTHELLKQIIRLLDRPDFDALEAEFLALYDVAALGTSLVSRPRGAGTWNSAGVTKKRIAAFLKKATSSIALTGEFSDYLAVDALEVDRNTRVNDSLNRIERN